MNDGHEESRGDDPATHGNDFNDRPNELSPLPGEPGIPDLTMRRPVALSGKGLLAAGILIGGLVGVTVISIERFTASGRKPDDSASKRVSDRPAAATAEPRRLDVAQAARLPRATPASAGQPRIPALVPTADEAAEPIGVRRTGQVSSNPSGRPPVLAPEDAPAMLVASRQFTGQSARSDRRDGAPAVGEDAVGTTLGQTPPDSTDPLAATKRNLQAYQRQLQGMLDNIGNRSAPATNGFEESGSSPAVGSLPADSIDSGIAPGVQSAQSRSDATKVMARQLADRSLTLPKGTAFTCALKTKVVSATSGPVTCQVQRNVYGDDGRVLLVERGTHLDGDYRVSSIKPGTVRIPVIWTRLRTPQGVVVDLDSPGTGKLGESGIDGYVDNRWSERIGAALLLSLIDDSVQMVIQEQASHQDNNAQANTVLLPSTTANTNKLAEKVLDSTINIPPLIYQNQGSIVGIVVAHDIDFSSVYALRPSAVGMASVWSPPPADASASAAGVLKVDR